MQSPDFMYSMDSYSPEKSMLEITQEIEAIDWQSLQVADMSDAQKQIYLSPELYNKSDQELTASQRAAIQRADRELGYCDKLDLDPHQDARHVIIGFSVNNSASTHSAFGSSPEDSSKSLINHLLPHLSTFTSASTRYMRPRFTQLDDAYTSTLLDQYPTAVLPPGYASMPPPPRRSHKTPSFSESPNFISPRSSSTVSVVSDVFPASFTVKSFHPASEVLGSLQPQKFNVQAVAPKLTDTTKAGFGYNTNFKTRLRRFGWDKIRRH